MTHSDLPAEPSSKASSAGAARTTQGNLLGLLTAAFYSLFTLLPNSNSLMVAWSWVFIWQVGLLCPVFWLLGLLWQKRLCWLGHGFDWLVGVLLVGLIVSAGLAPFPMQAHWYSWVAFCCLAALYALSTWLSVPERRSRLLVAQGYLSLAFIVVSLTLWSTTTLLPELARLRSWQAVGVTLPFDFTIVELRNWAPIGHQNYVAGYLVLALPLLLGLGLVQTGWRRTLWLVGAGLGLLDLYTTSSRGGWLGLLVIAIVAFAGLLWRSRLPRLGLGAIGLAGVALLALLVLTNNRFQSLLTGVLSGQAGGELAYRLITMTTGWSMGWSRPFTGVGPGGVPLLFQHYRPGWAGQQTAEWAYQLHSTPAHLWAELGLWAVLVGGGTIALLVWLAIVWLRQVTLPAPTSSLLIGSLFMSLLGYGVVSLTDYQLDNICISGTLVVFVAVLTAECRDYRASRLGAVGDRTLIELSTRSPHPLAPLLLHPLPFLPLMGVGILIAAGIWLAPVHRAWLLSSQGFGALSRGDVATFVERLNRSHQLASWEPYYAYQLGWNLGNLGLQASDPSQQQTLIKDGIDWLKLANQSAPNQEFGSTNLAWLLLNRDPKAASQAFARSAQLLPAKRSVFYGLGLSLLAQGQSELAIAAMTLEALRDPAMLTSRVWNLPELQPLYAPITRRFESDVAVLLATTANPVLTSQLHQVRGGLRWWQGNLAGARTDLATAGTALSRIVLDLAEQKPVSPSLIAAWGSTGAATTRSGALTIAAWLDPAKRQNLLQQAWIVATHTDPPPKLISDLTATMARSSTFDQWLKQNAPSQSYRRERTGFGVLSRHIDGSIPRDFFTVVDNVPIAQFCKDLIPQFDYAPELDTALQAQRDALLQKVLKL